MALSLAGDGAFMTLSPTRHCRTNAQVIERFMPVRIGMNEMEHDRCWIEVSSAQ